MSSTTKAQRKVWARHSLKKSRQMRKTRMAMIQEIRANPGKAMEIWFRYSQALS